MDMYSFSQLTVKIDQAKVGEFQTWTSVANVSRATWDISHRMPSFKPLEMLFVRLVAQLSLLGLVC